MPRHEPATRLGLNVHVNPTPLDYATRILKVTQALTEGKIVSRIIVIGTQKSGLPERERIDASREVIRIGPAFHGSGRRSKALWFLEWSWRVFARLRGERIAMVNCHTLSTLPISVALKWWHRAILVYEPHELETETVTSRGVRRLFAKLLERALVGQAAGVITVSESIARAYERDYKLRNVPFVVNAPVLARTLDVPNPVFREIFGIPAEHAIFIYQGDLSEPRGIPLLLDAFLSVPADRHLVLMGVGPLEERVRQVAKAVSNIHYHPAVPPARVLEFTRGADVGFALLTDDCLNHRYALPNKLFQYLHAGLPVVASELPEMASVVDLFGCGWKVNYDVDSIASVVASIDHVAIASRREGVTRARGEMNWDREAAKLVDFYNRLLTRVPA